MRILEILEALRLNELLNLPKANQQQQRPIVVQPEVVTQKQKVDKLVAKIAASDAHRAPTQEEKVLATDRSVALDDFVLGEPCFREMTIDVAGKYKGILQ